MFREICVSWDLFIQRLPAGISSVDEIPDDFVPGPIGTRELLISQINDVAPDADFSDPSWGRIERADCSIELSMGDDEIVDSIGLFVHGGDAAIDIVVGIIARLGLPALDTSSGTGLFSAAMATASFERWRSYGDSILRR